jgi:HAMP domain-containing protein
VGAVLRRGVAPARFTTGRSGAAQLGACGLAIRVSRNRQTSAR